MSEKLLLVSHPSIEDIVRQLEHLDDLPGRYGEYVGRRPDAMITKTTSHVDEVYRSWQIAPEGILRVSHRVGRLLVFGFTRGGEEAIINIDPFGNYDTLGTIVLGEETVSGY